ncbi:hypothetical protein [Sphingomonas floccifaciens]|uniref:hypothetical protein n=1 Tax=Sphingomonas floccifaciens TaxID=1844115 RepID=UPI0036D335BB
MGRRLDIKGADEFIFVTQDARAGNGPGVCVWAKAAQCHAGARSTRNAQTGRRALGQRPTDDGGFAAGAGARSDPFAPSRSP